LVVAVPAFNAVRYVAETLSSLNDNGGGVRWWLQDGGSSDGTLDVAKRMARLGDTVVSGPDNGQADALNRAVGEMGGAIIGFLNADDRWKPWTAGRVLEAFEANPEIDLVYGAVEWIDAAGQVTGRHAGQLQSYEEILDIYRVWWADRQWVQPEVFFRRSLWERVGGFDASMHLAFDYDFWVRCLKAGARVVRLDAVLAEFRLHPDQKSAQARRAADEIRSVVERELEAPNPLGWALKRRVGAELGYERFQLDNGAKSGFASMLARHPDWLLSPWVRERIWKSAKGRVSCGGKGAGT
jgi:glycosyltransferase involved in cell wall biosynthesis